MSTQSVPTTLPNPFHTFPHPPQVPVSPFTASIPREKVEDLKKRLEEAPQPRPTFENSTTDEQLGVTREWLLSAIKEWKQFDWRKTEEEINSFPNFTAKISHIEHDFDVHFVALFSKRQDAVPIIASHGWPGSFMEFFPLLKHLMSTYTPDDLPVHLIVPSLIGYGFSSPPPVDVDFATRDNAPIFDQLMRGLGFDTYIAQGGDVGSLVSRFLGQDFESCKTVHLNMVDASGIDVDEVKPDELDDFDRACLERYEYFQKWEFAYKHEHSTKHATIGFVLESSPVALLSWIGEKFLVWSDDPSPSLQFILADVSLYWLTQTMSTSLYHYRSSYGRKSSETFAAPKLKNKPVGYSLFKKEIAPIPRVWAEKRVNLVWFKRHEQGGHFAALEQPAAFWEDLKDFTEKVWQ